MPEHRGVSAAEKYAELEKAGASRPRCSCHGEVKAWFKSWRYSAGGYWRCSVKRNEIQNRYHQTDLGRATKQRYEHSERGKETAGLRNDSRLYAGAAYLGTVRFTQTEVEAMLSGTS